MTGTSTRWEQKRNGVPWELDGANSAEIRGLTLIHGLAGHVETVQKPEGTALVMLVGLD
jgi:hypothetical protein